MLSRGRAHRSSVNFAMTNVRVSPVRAQNFVDRTFASLRYVAQGGQIVQLDLRPIQETSDANCTWPGILKLQLG